MQEGCSLNGVQEGEPGDWASQSLEYMSVSHARQMLSHWSTKEGARREGCSLIGVQEGEPGERAAL